MKQPAFVSRLAPGYRTLEAWVSLATPPVAPPVSPMTTPTQPTLPPQVVIQPMPQPMNPVLPSLRKWRRFRKPSLCWSSQPFRQRHRPPR